MIKSFFIFPELKIHYPPTPTATKTLTPTPTGTVTFTPTTTPTYTATPTPTGSVTFTPTATTTNTATPTQTATATPTATATWTPTATSTPGSPSDLIFADGFESGNLSAWTSCATDGGDLSASNAAKLVGNFGMQIVIDDNNSAYCIDESPSAEKRYRARFYFDPNSIAMVSNDAHYLLFGRSSASTIVLRVDIRFVSGTYQIRSGLVDDGTVWSWNPWVSISDMPHYIEFDWNASTGPGLNNGSLAYWVDGIPYGNLTGIDNDTRQIDTVQLGAIGGVDTGTRGTYFFDEFESRRESYIGP